MAAIHPSILLSFLFLGVFLYDGNMFALVGLPILCFFSLIQTIRQVWMPLLCHDQNSRNCIRFRYATTSLQAIFGFLVCVMLSIVLYTETTKRIKVLSVKAEKENKNL